MRRFFCFVAAAVGFVVAATFAYLFFVEYLGWEHGAIKISAPIAIAGAILGWEVVEKGARLIFGEADPVVEAEAG